jgi:hypothetical protein
VEIFCGDYLRVAPLPPYPVALTIAIARNWLQIPAFRRDLAKGSIEREGTADALASQIDRISGILQRQIERLRLQRSLLANVLFRQETLLLELRRMEKDNLRLLDSDRSVLEALSTSHRLSERGVLNVSSNPMLKDLIAPGEVLRILLLASQKGGAVAALARYHLLHQHRLTNPENSAEIMRDWPEPTRAEAKEILAGLGR